MPGCGGIFCTSKVLKKAGRFSLSRLFGLYGKGMTIEHRGLRGARGSEGGFMAAIDDEMLQRFALRLNFHES
jgi:hypothetical protein